MDSNPHFLNMTPSEWKSALTEYGEKSFRINQVTKWVYEQRAVSLESMSNLSKDLRAKLGRHFKWDLPKISSQLEGEDGSTKLLLESERGFIETVIMRYGKRTSLCVSSQVGCKLACSFCQTGKLGFIRNLRSEEILAQFAIAEQIVRKEGRSISHIVFMGMGEPLDNYDHVIKAVNQFTSKDCYGLNPKHVTVSTSGIVKRIDTLAEDAQCALAVSLHAARDDLRTELMPINKRYATADLKRSLIDWQKNTGKKITIEYILIKDKNCGRREAKDLVRFIHGMRAKVNLIPFNSHPGMPYEKPDDEEIREFQKYLSERGIPSPVRYSKGSDVSAACGQLAAKKADELLQKPERHRALTT
jgi:23S rRNA (adenine2503-C2)-methyltransferase